MKRETIIRYFIFLLLISILLPSASVSASPDSIDNSGNGYDSDSNYEYPDWLKTAFENYFFTRELSGNIDDDFTVGDDVYYNPILTTFDPMVSYTYAVNNGYKPGDQILVILKHDFSDPFQYDYAAGAFPEIDVEETIISGLCDAGVQEIHEKWVDNSEYREIIYLTLGSEDTVESAINKLSRRLYVDFHWISFVETERPEIELKYAYDLNDDNIINARDVIDLMKSVIGIHGSVPKEKADFNGDGKLNARDVILFMKAVVLQVQTNGLFYDNFLNGD